MTTTTDTTLMAAPTHLLQLALVLQMVLPAAGANRNAPCPYRPVPV